MIAGLIWCATGLNGWSADSQTYQFDDWKLTITPGPVAVKPARALSRAEIVPAPAPFDAKPGSDRSRMVVQPVSMKLTTPVDSPAAAPAAVSAEAVPALKAAAEPTPIVPGNASPPIIPLPPAPGGAEQPAPEVDCCNALPIITPRTADLGANATPFVPQTALYRDIYFSIPFNRAEYNAYPSYRHDATMELLFNQMRPTVIQRGTQNVYHFGMGYGYGVGSPYNYAYGPGYGYGPGFPQQYYPYNYGLRIHSSR